MDKRKNLAFKPLEPELGEQPQLREPVEENSESGLCVTLRHARMQAGYELQDVAKVLRIQHQHLQSLEEDRFADLPGNTYAVGFLRSYSEFLGLDPEEMIRRYKQETLSSGPQTPLSFPTPSKEGRAPKPWLILAALVLAGAAYGGWYYFSMRGADNTDLVSDLSSKLTEATGLDTAEETAAANAKENASSHVARQTTVQGGAVEATASMANADGVTLADAVSSPPLVTSPMEPDQAGVGDQPVISSASLWDEPPALSAAAAENAAADAEPVAVTTEAIDATVIKTEAAAEFGVATADVADTRPVEVNALLDNEISTASVSADREMEANNNVQVGSPLGQTYVPQLYGRRNEDYRVVITAKADSWVQVQGPQNELLLTRILRAGDSYRVPDRQGLVLVTGNAGALQISVDGVVVEAIGPIGAVRRDVVLDAEQLKAGVTTE